MRIGKGNYLDREIIFIVQNGEAYELQLEKSVLEILQLSKTERNEITMSAAAGMPIPIEQLELLPPVEPRAMRDFLVFEAHIAGMKKSFDGDGSVPEAWYEAPTFLFMNPWSVVGGTAQIPMPPLTKRLDFELEIAAIVKKQARDVSVEEAGEYIAGYCIFNDWSARDIQGREMQVGLGPNKGKDFANTLGPWITTPDELENFKHGDRLRLEMSVLVNGKEYGRDSSHFMSWSFEELLCHASRDAIVGEGDVLASGTCGFGSMSELWSRTKQFDDPEPLQPGDVVEMTIEGLGTIRNKIVASTSPGYVVPPARRTYDQSRL